MSSYDDKKKLHQKILRINKKELYFQIYQILLDNKEKFNTNSNGVFFDLNAMSQNTINKISKILDTDTLTKDDILSVSEEKIPTEINDYSEILISENK
jgi:hypothetical protein